MEEFTEKERELRTSSLTEKQPNIGSKETSLDEVLCRHVGRKPFAYGLCNECYEEVAPMFFLYLFIFFDPLQLYYWKLFYH
ncbi:hypothetical protein Gotur_010503 [Gossypium turneri]